MDFYEALKSGMTAEEITEGFNKELEEAVKRVEEEREAKRRKTAEEEQKAKGKAALDAARQKAAAEVVEYLKTLFDVKGIETTDTFSSNGEILTNILCHFLKESEKNVCAKLDLVKTLEATIKNESAQKEASSRGHHDCIDDPDDDTILFNFLSDLF